MKVSIAKCLQCFIFSNFCGIHSSELDSFACYGDHHKIGEMLSLSSTYNEDVNTSQECYRSHTLDTSFCHLHEQGTYSSVHVDYKSSDIGSVQDKYSNHY